MSKPKNIPADVDAEAWEAAADAMASVGWFATSMIRGAYSAILAATAEERKACELTALEQRCERGTPWDAACVAIADAIRKRGGE